MPISETRFIKRCAQWKEKSEISLVPRGTRGVYALLHHQSHIKKYDVVYIGMALHGGMRSRLKSHMESGTKIWSHFSIFEVWDNISEVEIAELEGLFREIYRKDKTANRFNKQKRYKKLQDIWKDDFTKW